jgi:hypothetical protein
MNAKRIFICVALLTLVITLSGCWTLSIYPLFTEEDLITDPMLEGIWGDPEDPEDETWDFKQMNDKSYRLIVREDEQRLLIDPAKDGLFEVHLLQLGDYKFLDIYPEEPEGVNGFYKSHVIPAHSFVRVRIEGNVLLTAGLDIEWLGEQLDQGLLDISHEQRNDEIVLTASTEELQRWVLENIDVAFEKFEELSRLQ